MEPNVNGVDANSLEAQTPIANHGGKLGEDPNRISKQTNALDKTTSAMRVTPALG